MLSGMYRIETQSSYYIFDFDKFLFRREGKENTEGYYYNVALRKDGEWIPFDRVKNLEVGQSLYIASQAISDDPDTYTLRTTTPVLSISPHAEN